jgi:uncharacterized membrane protein
MERRLANIIATPGMVVAVAMAVGLLSVQPGLAAAGLDARQAGASWPRCWPTTPSATG